MSNSTASCEVIIVTHNSEKFIERCINCLQAQTAQPSQIIIIDSGSADRDYLEKYKIHSNVEIYFAGNDIGFCKGNNEGWSKLDLQTEFVLFLNPDAFLTPSFLEKAVAFMKKPENGVVGAMTGTILGYDITQDKPSGLYDTTGVFQKWWGQWYDRGQGQKTNAGMYDKAEDIPAICGAVYMCRREALQSVVLRNSEIFDNDFFMYKEDIDLSIRLRKKGWQLQFVPELVAYHCRGWNRDRSRVPKWMKIYSAQNELKVNFRNRSPIGVPYSLLKYGLVKCFNI